MFFNHPIPSSIRFAIFLLLTGSISTMVVAQVHPGQKPEVGKAREFLNGAARATGSIADLDHVEYRGLLGNPDHAVPAVTILDFSSETSEPSIKMWQQLHRSHLDLTITRGLSGAVAFMRTPQGTTALASEFRDELLRVAFSKPETILKLRHHQDFEAKFVETRQVGRKEIHLIRVRFRDLVDQIVGIDSETDLICLVRSDDKSRDAHGMVTLSYYDYQEAQGVLVPFKRVATMDGAVVEDWTASEIRVNGPLDKSIFDLSDVASR